MSMSGVDRCYAVGLIPLLAQLRQALNFKLYIYTDDCVPAEFTPDGQIANDHAIAWNNSNWVNLFARMGAETFDPQEDHLLVIDSLGDGEESRWFSSWGESLRREAGEAQERYLTPEWAAARRLVAGRYDRVASIPPDRLPAGWADLVRRNTRERWLDTPALEHYLVRWAFNPDFGAVRHGTFAPLDKYYVSLRSVAGGLRYKFKTIHLLTPRTTQHTLDRLKYDIQPLNLVDFHHQVETLEGVASVFANIVFGKETVRLRVPEIRFTRPQADAAPAAHPDRPHTEMVKGLKCFASCPSVDDRPATKWSRPRLKRGATAVGQEDIPFCEIDLSTYVLKEWLCQAPTFPFDPTWSEFSQQRAVADWWDNVTKNEVINYCDEDYSYLSTRQREETAGHAEARRRLLAGVEFTAHRTRALREPVEAFFAALSPAYLPYLERVPLRHVVWCTDAIFKPDRAAISCRPWDDRDEWRRQVWHELFHYLAWACPPVGVVTNQMLRYRSGTNGLTSTDEAVQVAPGEWALPPAPDQPAWIVPYAGKYYERRVRGLCNDDEILPCYGEFAGSPADRLRLRATDEEMTKLVAFVLMGGPIAGLERLATIQRRQALDQIRQSQERAEKAQEVKVRGRRKRGATTDPEPEEPPEQKQGSFGL
jgi:hypothetical protein